MRLSLLPDERNKSDQPFVDSFFAFSYFVNPESKQERSRSVCLRGSSKIKNQ